MTPDRNSRSPNFELLLRNSPQRLLIRYGEHWWRYVTCGNGACRIQFWKPSRDTPNFSRRFAHYCSPPCRTANERIQRRRRTRRYNARVRQGLVELDDEVIEKAIPMLEARLRGSTLAEVRREFRRSDTRITQLSQYLLNMLATEITPAIPVPRDMAEAHSQAKVWLRRLVRFRRSL